MAGPLRARTRNVIFGIVLVSIIAFVGAGAMSAQGRPTSNPMPTSLFSASSYVIPLYLQAPTGNHSDQFLFDADNASAFVFDCASAAVTPSGCTETVSSPLTPQYNVTVTVKYPYVSANDTQDNCNLWLPGQTSPGHFWCMATGPDSFVVVYPYVLVLP